MCGRFSLSNKESVKSKFDIDILPRFNISPGSDVNLLASGPLTLTWQLSPPWAKKPMNLINARFETLDVKPSFKDTSRCVFIVDGWYEWKRFFDWKRRENKNQPYYHHLEGEIFFMAGIYNDSGCAIVTKEATRDLKNIHPRQPFLLLESQISEWLSGEQFIKDRCSSDIQIHTVSTYVNSPKNDSRECMVPIQ